MVSLTKHAGAVAVVPAAACGVLLAAAAAQTPDAMVPIVVGLCGIVAMVLVGWGRQLPFLSFGKLPLAFVVSVGSITPLARLALNETHYFGRNVSPLLARGSLLTGACMVGLTIGYLVGPWKGPNPAAGLEPMGTERRVAARLLVGGTVMSIGYVLLTGTSPADVFRVARGLGLVRGAGIEATESLGYLLAGFDVLMVGLAVSCAWMLSRRRWLSASTIALFAFGFFGAIGFRFRLMILGVVLCKVLIGLVRSPRKARLGMAVLAAVVVLALPLVSLYRGSDAGRFETPYSRLLVDSYDLAAPTAILVADVPSRFGYLDGRSYPPILTQWVPSTLWPDKPRSPTVGLLEKMASRGVGPAVPFWAEVYANFGYAAAVATMIGIGVAFRWLDSWVWDRASLLSMVRASLGLAFVIQAFSRGHAVSIAGYAFIVLVLPAALGRFGREPRDNSSTQVADELGVLVSAPR